MCVSLGWGYWRKHLCGVSALFCWLAFYGNLAWPRSSQRCKVETFPPQNCAKSLQLRALPLVNQTFSLCTRRCFYFSAAEDSKVPKFRLALCGAPLSILPRICPEPQRQMLSPCSWFPLSFSAACAKPRNSSKHPFAPLSPALLNFPGRNSRAMFHITTRSCLSWVRDVLLREKAIMHT